MIATGLEPRAATIKAMEEITGPVMAITLVLTSVFLPCCFLGGVSGQFFRQFAVTISVSTVISAINAIFAGMLGVTMFGIFLTPVFFYVIQGFGNKEIGRKAVVPVAEAVPASLASNGLVVGAQKEPVLHADYQHFPMKQHGRPL
ncbi:MAG TPA: efflux RND transporter permease subunit [Gemmataceae bacterium]|nr:efflux RND transporter permease subunit [Gemmataceae bacterium]